MQIVIDISKEKYDDIMSMDWVNCRRFFDEEIRAIHDGKVLPKGHGRLIDADELERTMEKDKRRALSFVDLTDFVWLAPTIIPAESEVEE